MIITAKLEGDKELLRKLEKIRDAVKKDSVIQRSLKAGAFIVLGDAQMRVPVDTGALRASLSTMDGPGSREVMVYTNMIYARRIELGFHGRDSLGRFYNQSGQPYLRPALDSNRAAISQAVGMALRAEMGL